LTAFGDYSGDWIIIGYPKNRTHSLKNPFIIINLFVKNAVSYATFLTNSVKIPLSLYMNERFCLQNPLQPN